MNTKIRSLVATAVTSTFLLGYGASAMADSTFDLVDALVKKGVLTEEEAIPLLKGREADIAAADKKIKKGRVSISDVIDSAELYGDIRVRAEYRQGEDDRPTSIDEERTRGRYKVTFGVKTKADDFYTDLAFAMGKAGRSDNATFAGGDNKGNGNNGKEALFVKTAMVGWNATDWLTLEAGRIKNPLYTTPMVWDGDLTFEGLAEKVQFNFGNIDVFGNFVQSQYIGDRKNFSNGAGNATTNEILAFQGGAKFKITDSVSAKAALTYTTYTNGDGGGADFAPAVGGGTGLGSNVTSVNDISTIEIPAEISFKTANDIGLKVFADYVHNLDGSDREDAACVVSAAVCNLGGSDNAWLLGFGAEMKQGKKSQKGDWSAKIWYQDVGVYALDPNAVDSDFMDSRVNMKGVVFKSEYALRDNVFVNFAAGHATRKDKDISAAGNGGDIGLNIDDYDLYQLDMTYKF
jgi:polyhydroxyalkanoate synthesis regulator phasin